MAKSNNDYGHLSGASGGGNTQDTYNLSAGKSVKDPVNKASMLEDHKLQHVDYGAQTGDIHKGF